MDEGGARVHHLKVEDRTAVGERRRHVADQVEGDGTVQLGVGDHARGEGAVGKVAKPVVLVAPRSELPAQGRRRGRFDAFRIDLTGGDSAPHDLEEDVDDTGEGLIDLGVSPPDGAGAVVAVKQQVLRLVTQGPGPVGPAYGEPLLVRRTRTYRLVGPASASWRRAVSLTSSIVCCLRRSRQLAIV